MKRKGLLGAALVLGLAMAVVIFVLLSAGGVLPGASITPTPTRYPRPVVGFVTCTLSASETRVKVGDTARLTLAIGGSAGGCKGIGWFTYRLFQSPLLFAENYHAAAKQNLDAQLVQRVEVSSCLETFDVEAVQAGQGVIEGRITYERQDARTGIFSWADCVADSLELVVEP